MLKHVQLHLAINHLFATVRKSLSHTCTSWTIKNLTDIDFNGNRRLYKISETLKVKVG